MKLVTAEQMRELDNTTIERIGIPGIVLMENAASGVFEVIASHEARLARKRAVVVCGGGNNGGDGFAIARMLHNAYAESIIALATDPEKIKGDARINFEVCRKLKIPLFKIESDNETEFRQLLDSSAFIVDALLGTGVNGELKPFYLAVINAINSSKKTVYSVDVPSGMIVDDGRVLNGAVRAAHTITFGAPKIGLFVYPGAEYAGQVYIVDIGIPTQLTDKLKTSTFLTTPAFVMDRVRPRKATVHKGECGRVLIIGGSRGMSGAPVLAGLAALRTGAGLVYLAVPESIADITDKKATECITIPLPDDDGAFSGKAFSKIEDKLAQVDAVVLGPGISVSPATCRMVKNVLSHTRVPVIVDADGLNCLAELGPAKALKPVRAPIVLTPHPGEMSKLAGSNTKTVQAERLSTANAFARRHSTIVLLKGAHTVIASSAGDTYINPTGNPGMATAGSGDVLSGIIGAFLAEGIDALGAAVCGAYIHGLAGDRAAACMSERQLTAGDIVSSLRKILKKLEEKGLQDEDIPSDMG